VLTGRVARRLGVQRRSERRLGVLMLHASISAVAVRRDATGQERSAAQRAAWEVAEHGCS
jgi:hypothetical protein